MGNLKFWETSIEHCVKTHEYFKFSYAGTPVIAAAISRRMIAPKIAIVRGRSLVFRFAEWGGKRVIRPYAKLIRAFVHTFGFEFKLLVGSARDVTHRRLRVNSFSSMMRAVCASLRQFASFPGGYWISRDAMKLIDTIATRHRHAFLR